MPDNSDSISGVKDKTLAHVVAGAAALPTTDADDADRFTIEVRKIVEGRACDGWADEGGESGIAVFVLVDYPRPIVSKFNGTNVLDLPVKSVSILGRIYFLGRDASNGGYIDLPCNIDDVAIWLEDNDLANETVIIAYKEEMKFAIRHKGIFGDVINDAIRDKPVLLSLESLEQGLERFYESSLITPMQCAPDVWEPKMAKKYVPAPEAEKAIQAKMVLSLNGWFRGLVKVEKEDATPAGRIDVRLMVAGDDQEGLRYWAIIELKVTRSFHNCKQGDTPKKVSDSTNVAAIAEGVTQADQYSSDRKLSDGFLEVFDMREDKADNLMDTGDVKNARTKCKGNIHCQTREMFGSAQDARNAGVF